MKNKLKVFNEINNDFFKLKGKEKERAKYLIKKLNFNEICIDDYTIGQIIVMICYFVKCENNKNYNRKNCKKAFKEYNISNNIHDRFLMYLAQFRI